MRTILTASLVLASLASQAALAHPPRCRTSCWYDRYGFRTCRTVCNDHGHPHHPGHPGHGHGHGNDLSELSSISALLLSTSAIDNADQKQVLLVNVTEDAANYLETGRMTGLLPQMLQLAREEAAKTAGLEAAQKLSNDELVVALLESAEKLLKSE